MAEILGIVCIILLIWLNKKSREFTNNNFKLIMIVGKKGCGKTTDICKWNMIYRKKGWTTYCTEEIPDSYKVDPDDIGYYEMEKNSVLFIDEIGIIWHARDFKKFAKEVREWFKLQRHRHLVVYCYSQSFDIDKSLRDLCDEIWVAKKVLGLFTVKKKVIKEISIVKATAEGESRFADDLKVVPWIVPGSRKYTYIPKYARYFDSFSAPPLKVKSYPYIPPKVYEMHLRVQMKLLKAELCRILQRMCLWLFLPAYRMGLIVYVRYLGFRWKGLRR